MKFSVFSRYLNQLEQTSSRNQMTKILAELLVKASAAEVDKVCYLSLGRLGPPYDTVEFGISDKLMIKILAQVFEIGEDGVKKKFREAGDLGDIAERLMGQQNTPDGCKKSIQEVFERLYRMATDSGVGSQGRKTRALAELINQADPLSARYLVRIPIGRLRLGFSDVTILDALSWMLVGNKSARKEIERAYNVLADVGRVARLVKKGGLKALANLKVEIGVPIRPAMSERLGSAEEIVKKLERFAVEPKMDGFRVQIHIRKIPKSKFQKPKKIQIPKSKENQRALFEEFGIKEDIFVRIFSRKLEDTTAMFPDIVRVVQQLPVKNAILDGEAIAYNPETQEFLPFQETVQRKRKYGIAKKAQEVPLKVFVFDLLYLNGKSLLKESFAKRRQALEEIFTATRLSEKLGSSLGLTVQRTVNSVDRLRELFNLYISEGLEGVMCKKLDSLYQAGARNFNWVKYKRATEGTGLADTIDAVVMGYYAGRGQRNKFGLGAFLVGVRDKKKDDFRTLAKIGTGLTDEQWREMYERVKRIKVSQRPKEYEVSKELVPDTWVKPALVVEVRADEITRSPVHTAGRGSTQVEKGTGAGTGLALRFPRLVRFRDDRIPGTATTVQEVLSLYKMQRR